MNKDTENYVFILTIFFILSAVFIIRIYINYILDIPLHYDEAQYWGWSKEHSWGYFSKPPLLAWAINFTTKLCGNTELCIRSLSPFFHTITTLTIISATYLYLRKRFLAFLAGFLYLIMPGVTFSSLIVSTDIPLLFFSALISIIMVLFYKKALNENFLFIALGITLGLGFLAKYAVLYLMIGILISAAFNEFSRNIFLNKKILISLLIFISIIFPNILWNYSNGFVTFQHTLSNANYKGLQVNIIETLAFVSSQIIIFGFFPMIFIIYNTFSSVKLDNLQKSFLFLFLFPLFLISLLAVFSKANANWAVIGYPFGCVFIATLLSKKNYYKISFLVFNQAFFSTALVLFLINLPIKDFDPFSKIRNIKDLANIIRYEIENENLTAFVSDNRKDYAHLLYYLKDIKVDRAKYNSSHKINDHYDLTTNLKNINGSRVLFLTRTEPTEEIIMESENISILKKVVYDLGKKKKQYNFYIIKNWNPE